MGQENGILLAWLGQGRMDPGLLDRVRRRVGDAFGVAVAVTAAPAPLEEALDARRRQHSSTKLLRWLLQHPPAPAGKLLGVTDADLFIPVLTFVFGEAQVGGRAAVVSVARLRETFDRRPAPGELVEARLLKECLHELGHTFGLVHCALPSCVMSRSNSVLDVDGKHPAFCRACRTLLAVPRAERMP
jgi:archaemetzincin